MKINLYKKLTLLILVTFIFPTNAAGISSKTENPYEVPLHEYSRRGSTQWQKDFNRQDIIDAMNHIEYLLEDPAKLTDSFTIEQLNYVYKHLQEIKDKLFDNGTYVLVEILLVSIPESKDGRKYLAPYDIEVYGATPKNGLKIYLT